MSTRHTKTKILTSVGAFIFTASMALNIYQYKRYEAAVIYDFNTPEFYNITEVLPCPEGVKTDKALELEDIIRGDISCADGKCRPTYTYKEIDSGDVSLHWVWDEALEATRICRKWDILENGQRMVHLWSDLNGGGGVDYILILDAALNVTDRIINSY